VFQDLDATLKKILQDPAAPTLLKSADVSFETPDKNFVPGHVTVDLFLYDVKENRELRDPTPIIQKVGTSFIRRPPPVRVDCSYIVTAWSSQTGAAKTAEEHQLLAQVLLWLSRFPTLPAGALQGALATQLYPPPTMVAQMDPNKNAGDFWIALGIPPRPAFYLTVTIAFDLDLPTEAPLVTTTIAWYQQDADPLTREEWINIGGTLLDAAGHPVTRAWVRLEPIGHMAETDEEGRFVFVKVKRGANYLLRAGAPGKGETSRNIEIPSPTGEYDLQLP